MTVEGLAVGKMGSRVASIRRGVVPATFRELLLCSFFEFIGV